MASRADPHDPQFAEIALFLATVTVGIDQSPVNGFRCRPVQTVPATDEATGQIQNLFSSPARFKSTCYARHRTSPY
jgi:hypothetical protein